MFTARGSSQPTHAKLDSSAAFGLHDVMTAGFPSVRSQMCAPHPLEATEKNFRENAEKLNLANLQFVQGLHAPLRILMEKKALSKTQRLPFLPSSNLAQEVIDGTDTIIQPEDYLNNPMDEIEVLAPPHFVMEKHLHLY